MKPKTETTKININRADQKSLQKIIHIGPVRSLDIITNRPFRDLFELSSIRGLGKKRMWDIINPDYAAAQTA